MICMELTRIDAIFSRTTVMLFFCRNESSPNEKKLFDDFFGTKEVLEASLEDQKVKEVATTYQSVPGALGVGWWVVGTSWPIWT